MQSRITEKKIRRTLILKAITQKLKIISKRFLDHSGTRKIGLQTALFLFILFGKWEKNVFEMFATFVL